MQAAVIFLAVLGSALAVPTKVNRIVGGTATTVNNYPFIANMQHGVWGVWWHQTCGGTVITTTSILSAAHCYHNDPTNVWRVVLGSSFTNGTGGTQFTVSRFIPHSNYNHQTLIHDICLVRLQSSAVWSNNVGPARLSGPAYVVPDGAQVTYVGYGNREFQGSRTEELQFVNINTINQTLCAERYRELHNQPGYDTWPSVTDNMICTLVSGGGRDACHGDDGGPLIHFDNINVGVVSFGRDCGSSVWPTVCTRTSSYISWIQANV